MISWQKRDQLRATRAKSKKSIDNVSVYGRPLQKVER